MEKIVLLGCGGHAKSIIDSLEETGQYEIIGFLDTEQKSHLVYRSYKVIGTDDALIELYRAGVKNAFITVGYMGKSIVRDTLYDKISNLGFMVPTIIDNSAVIGKDAKIGRGTFVGKRAVVNANAIIGDMCIINTGAIIEHDCHIEEFTHISVGAVTCGNVRVGTHSLIGANATIIQGLTVGNHVIVGAGSIVSQNIESNMKYYEKREKYYE